MLTALEGVHMEWRSTVGSPLVTTMSWVLWMTRLFLFHPSKAASISVPDFLRIGQGIFWQFLSGFCPVVQGFCHIQLHPWLQPRGGYLWQAGCPEWAVSVLLNNREGRLGAWPWGSWVLRAECRPVSQLTAFVASRSRRLVMVWTLFGPMPCLSTDQACLVPCPSRTRGLP